MQQAVNGGDSFRISDFMEVRTTVISSVFQSESGLSQCLSVCWDRLVHTKWNFVIFHVLVYS